MTPGQFDIKVVARARGWIGTPYHHQQSAKNIGVDCLGLVRGVWREVCGDEIEAVPNYSSSWKRGGEDSLLAALHRHLNFDPTGISAGRVLAFRYRASMPVHHLAIATSSTHMIHAYHGRGASEVPIIDYWRRKLDSCFVFPIGRAE